MNNLDEYFFILLVLLIIYGVCLYSMVMCLVQKYIFRYGVETKAKVIVLARGYNIGRYNWNYKKAKKKASVSYELELTYEIEETTYKRKFYTPSFSQNEKILPDYGQYVPIKYLKTRPEKFVCTWDIMLKKTNKAQRYAIFIGPSLVIILTVFFVRVMLVL